MSLNSTYQRPNNAQWLHLDLIPSPLPATQWIDSLRDGLTREDRLKKSANSTAYRTKFGRLASARADHPNSCKLSYTMDYFYTSVRTLMNSKKINRILVLGATGRTGQLVVEAALAREISVVALARNPNKITIKSDRLTVIKGSAENRDDVKCAMIGVDAVVSTLNNSRASDLPWAKIINSPTMITDSIRNIVEEMKENKLRRILVMTANGAGETFNYAPFYFKWLITKTNLKVAYNDHNNQEALIKTSGLDWTIVRPVALTNSTSTGELIISYNHRPKPSYFISRSQVARFLIDSLEDKDLHHKCPVISAR